MTERYPNWPHSSLQSWASDVDSRLRRIEMQVPLLHAGQEHQAALQTQQMGRIVEVVESLHEDVRAVKEEVSGFRRHAWRTVWTFACGAALVIFNLMWSRLNI